MNFFYSFFFLAFLGIARKMFSLIFCFLSFSFFFVWQETPIPTTKIFPATKTLMIDSDRWHFLIKLKIYFGEIFFFFLNFSVDGWRGACELWASRHFSSFSSVASCFFFFFSLIFLRFFLVSEKENSSSNLAAIFFFF